MTLLHVAHLTHRFGGLTAISDFSLTVEPGELVGIIGPNGAGKTTLFNLITGRYRATEGRIVLDGRDLSGLRPEQVAVLGIAQTFQNIRLFRDLSVLENIRIAFYARTQSGPLAALLHTPAFHCEEDRLRRAALDLLACFGLEAHARTAAGALPYGLQRRLEIVRALAVSPKLLLLDEPAAGMNPTEIDALLQFILRIQVEYDLTVILIEHQMRLVMNLCERIVVLNFGATIAAGTPDEVRANPAVLEAYLGEQVPV